MINEPFALSAQSFQQAWLEVVRLLSRSHWEVRNLIAYIKNTRLLDYRIHQEISRFANHEGMLGPKHVAYTIFPHGLYECKGNAAALFHAYNRTNGLFERLHRKKPNWGTYFRRLTHYDKSGEVVNQLGNIIQAIRTRKNLSKAAFTAIIQSPGGETLRPLGGPCLNYIAIQIEPSQPITIGLLAVYRNHDFLERAYGNYWGLCNLLNFLAAEVGVNPGPLTCVSSHAYISDKKKSLMTMVRGL